MYVYTVAYIVILHNEYRLIFTLFSLSYIYSQSSQFDLSVFALQMISPDKDFRFMATSDLMTELRRDSIKLDDDSERKVL